MKHLLRSRRPRVPMLAAALSVASTAGASPPLPLNVPRDRWRPLDERVHEGLQQALEARLRAEADRAALLETGKLAVGLVDLTDPTAPRFARVNGDHMMYAASLPKIALLVGAYQALDTGSLADTPDLREDLTDMIRVSSNAAATRVIDRLGFERIEQVLTAPDLRLYDRERGGGLWVGKRFASSGPRRGDPLRNISHGATARQVCRFYYLLATGRLLSPARSAEMLEHLSRPALRHGFVGVLGRRAPKAKLFRKSGTWSRWRADSALVWGPRWRRYILCALVEGQDGAAVLHRVVEIAEELLRPSTSGLQAARPAPLAGD